MLVMREGRLVAELAREDASEEAVMQAAAGAAEAPASEAGERLLEVGP